MTSVTPPPPPAPALDPAARNSVWNQTPADCLPCRIIGATTFIGLGGYAYFQGMRQVRHDIEAWNQSQRGDDPEPDVPGSDAAGEGAGANVYAAKEPSAPSGARVEAGSGSGILSAHRDTHPASQTAHPAHPVISNPDLQRALSAHFVTAAAAGTTEPPSRTPSFDILNIKKAFADQSAQPPHPLQSSHSHPAHSRPVHASQPSHPQPLHSSHKPQPQPQPQPHHLSATHPSRGGIGRPGAAARGPVPLALRARKLGVLGLSVGMVGLGVYRLVM